MSCSQTLKPIMFFILTVVTLAFSHWALIRVYMTFCAPAGMLGFITTAFAIGSPVCSHLNTVQPAVTTYYTQIWGAAAAGTTLWIANCVSAPKPRIDDRAFAKDQWRRMRTLQDWKSER